MPAGGSKKPCGNSAVVDVVVPDTAAVVLCGDGRLRTSQTGAAWADDGQGRRRPGHRARSSGDRVVAVVPSAGACEGLAVVDTAKPAAALGCVALDLADVRAGTVAIATAGGSAWLRVGDDTYRAGASLKDWKKS